MIIDYCQLLKRRVTILKCKGFKNLYAFVILFYHTYWSIFHDFFSVSGNGLISLTLYIIRQHKWITKLLFKQHDKERFIIVAGVKEWEWESVPFVSLVSMLVLGLSETCLKLAASEGFQVESVAVLWERYVSAAGTRLSVFVRSTKSD